MSRIQKELTSLIARIRATTSDRIILDDLRAIEVRMNAAWDERFREYGICPYFEGAAALTDLQTLRATVEMLYSKG